MKRFVLVIGFAAAVSLAIAGPAWGKGPDVRVRTRVTITGPGLPAPIEVEGDISLFGYDGPLGPHNDLTDALLPYTGLQGAREDVGWFEFPPDLPSTLGPGYNVVYTFSASPESAFQIEQIVGSSGAPVATNSVRQTIYPYAPGRPYVYTPSQRFLGQQVGEWWWSAPPRLRDWLISRGLPSLPPQLANPRGEPAAEGAGPSRVWATWFGLLGLAALVAMGAVAGRREAGRSA